MRGRPRWELAVLAVASVVGLPVAAFFAGAIVGYVKLYRIPSSSMEPTLHCARPGQGCEARLSDRVWGLRYWFRSPGRGDLVAFHTPPLAAVRCGAGGIYVKRIVGLPGETFAERDGRVYIDGKGLREPYVRLDRRDFRSYPAVRIPPRSYVVLGDNRGASCDSRVWGFLPRRDIVAQIVVTYFPPSRWAFH
jgi:signal peptidase I